MPGFPRIHDGSINDPEYIEMVRLYLKRKLHVFCH